MDPTLLAGVLAAAGTSCLLYGWRLRTANVALERRLDTFVGLTEAPAKAASDVAPLRERTLVPLMRWVGRRMHSLLPDRQIERTRANLAVAGFSSRSHLWSFLAAKALLAGGAAAFGTLPALGSGPFRALLIGLLYGALGFYLPGIWLGLKMNARRAAMAKALPDALDLLSVGVGAGLGFDGALSEVTLRWKNALTEEFGTMLRDLRLGKSRREALRDMAERAGSPDVNLFVAAVLQADQLGTPLREALEVQADQVRLRRRQQAEETARKASIKMLIPMVCLIFPAMIVVILGPAIPALQSFMR
jgi:tight adherence protein C